MSRDREVGRGEAHIAAVAKSRSGSWDFTDDEATCGSKSVARLCLNMVVRFSSRKRQDRHGSCSSWLSIILGTVDR